MRRVLIYLILLMEHDDRENNSDEEIEEGREEIEKVFSFFTLGMLINIALAMALNARLNKDSILRLLDEELIRKIAYHAAPSFTFSEHAYWRLCQEVIFKYDYLNLMYYASGLNFFIVLKSTPFSFLTLSLKTFEVNDDDEYYIGPPSDELNAVRVAMKHALLNDLIIRPAPVPHSGHAPTGGNQLQDPRDASNVVKGIHLLEAVVADKEFYESNDYLLQTQAQKIMSIVDIMLHIATTMDTVHSRSSSIHVTTRTAAPTAPTAPDFAVRCPRCAAPMGEGGMPDALCTACWRLQNP